MTYTTPSIVSTLDLTARLQPGDEPFSAKRGADFD
jgi:hypothetical protein